MATEKLDPAKIEEAADRAIGYLSGAAVSALVYLGDQLGLYRALHGADPVTSAELAARAWAPCGERKRPANTWSGPGFDPSIHTSWLTTRSITGTW